jgi:hypothetical protein
MEYLRNSSHTLGKARERAKLAEHMVKVMEAIEFKRSGEKSADAKKADARTSLKYQEAIVEDAAATGELTKLYALREAASAVIEGWRTESATMRQATKM